MGQVYTHLILANDKFFIKNAELCLNKEGEIKKGGKNKWGRLLFFLGGFPPMKFKMPGSVTVEPRPPENIEYIRNKLTNAISKVNELSSRIVEYNPAIKIKHPAFGYLNAKEWFRMNEMHFRHHLRQKKRLETFLGLI